WNGSTSALTVTVAASAATTVPSTNRHHERQGRVITFFQKLKYRNGATWLNCSIDATSAAAVAAPASHDADISRVIVFEFRGNAAISTPATSVSATGTVPWTNDAAVADTVAEAPANPLIARSIASASGSDGARKNTQAIATNRNVIAHATMDGNAVPVLFHRCTQQRPAPCSAPHATNVHAAPCQR